jgi:hypothetical protein
MNPRPALRAVPDEDDETCLSGLLTKRAEVQVAVAKIDAEIAAFCRLWSAVNGYCVPLKPEQVRRAMEETR